MKVSHNYAEELVSNVEQVEASIDSSGKVFRILTSNLYSNKPQSITREIWSNAFDAHKDAGVADKPFEIVFPTSFRQEFMCRDFGNGLSHEFMINKYTVLGFSTKENSNESVGKWGIGRLAPLSYTSAYTVTSYHKGMMGVYNIVTLPSGRPVVQPMCEPVPSDEPSGVCISFPVNIKDIPEFRKAAERVALGFKVKPTVVGNPNHVWMTLETLNKGDNYEIYKDISGQVYGPMVRMGCVLYPIKADMLKNGSLIRHMNVILELPIGDLEVTPSREDLSYGTTEPTVASLEAAVDKMKSSMVSDLQTLVDACGSPYEAARAAYKGWQTLPSGFGAFDLTYRGKKIEKNYNLPMGSYYNNGYEYISLTQGSLNLKSVYFYKESGKDKITRYRERVALVRRAESAVFVAYNDTDTRALDQLKEFFPKSFFKDLATIQPPVKPKRSKGQLQVRDLSYKPVTINFSDGGFYIPMVNGEAAYHFPALTAVLLDSLGKQCVRVPKGLVKRFEDSKDWVDLLEHAKEWSKPYINDMKTVAVFYKPTLYNGNLLALKGEGLKKYHALVNVKELEFSCKDLKEPIPAKQVRSFLDVIGVSYAGGQDAANKAVEEENVRILKEEYPLLENMYYSAHQGYIDLVDELNETKNQLTKLKGSSI